MGPFSERDRAQDRVGKVRRCLDQARVRAFLRATICLCFSGFAKRHSACSLTAHSLQYGYRPDLRELSTGKSLGSSYVQVHFGHFLSSFMA